ncbi:MAG TPA: hypothetical protein VG537_04050 [Candidatus Kapabacteria bacterium]|jgi:hypothetical protein|nr:hypothetical protein [Candidatus Kapabacteria bacterium]
MDVGLILQLALLALLALAGVVIVLGALRAIPRPHKVKAYRYSKKGDFWIQGNKK